MKLGHSDWYLAYFGSSGVKIAETTTRRSEAVSLPRQTRGNAAITGRLYLYATVSGAPAFLYATRPPHTHTHTHTHTHIHTAMHADFLGCNVNTSEDRKRGAAGAVSRPSRDRFPELSRSFETRPRRAWISYLKRVVSSASETRETTGHLSRRDRIHDARE